MPNQRWESLDVLRGCALLGILIMNILSFGLPAAAYSNPTAYGDFGGLNQLAWWFTGLFADKKFISLFSLLFGAGVLLFVERAESRGEAAGRLHYRRMGWLLLFGLLHGWLLWYGDILYTYAIAGMVIYLMRRRTTAALLATAAVFYAVPALAYHGLIYVTLPYWSESETLAMQRYWEPGVAQVQAEIAAMTGTLAEQFRERAQWTLSMQTEGLLFVTFWHSSALMMLGMALYRTGFLTGQWSLQAYRRMAWLLVPGMAVTALGLGQLQRHDFDFAASFLDTLWVYLAAPATMLGYASLVLIWVRSGRLTTLRHHLACLGRTAFSHYILQTLIGVCVFHWLGFFGQFDRAGLLVMALGIGALQLWLAPQWLRHFRQGPLEALWRRLTYGIR
ncbi:MAG: DUF418 domain-containing protein [Saccharospirillum sp.]